MLYDTYCVLVGNCGRVSQATLHAAHKLMGDHNPSPTFCRAGFQDVSFLFYYSVINQRHQSQHPNMLDYHVCPFLLMISKQPSKTNQQTNNAAY